MNYIIDGHNLIATLPELDLNMPDDEQRLIELLVRFSQSGPKRVEVYFDGAGVGQAGERNFGRVKAHFVLYSTTADQAIRTRLQRLRSASRNWVVVTSDRAVQAAAREVHAQVMRSEDFSDLLHVELLQANLGSGSGGNQLPVEATLSEAEVQEWLELFKRRGKHSI